MLTFQLEQLKQTRANVLKRIEGLSIESLNYIPTGFSNNLIWNFAHILVTQQLLCYGRAGLGFKIPKEWIEAFRKGTRPTTAIELSEFEAIKAAFMDTIPLLEQDLSNNLFNNYASYETSYGLVLSNIEEAVAFNNLHEAMHLGAMIALTKQVAF